MTRDGWRAWSQPTGGPLRLMLPLLLIAILLLATALRFHRLGEQSLWYDEGVAYAHSLRTLPQLIQSLQTNVHVPAYFAFLGIWQDLAGDSEFALRSLSALFSICSVAWTYALGKRLFHPGAGLAAAALTALNSFSIYYAQEVRMYAMLTAVAAGSMWLFIGLLRQGFPRRAIRSIIGLGLLNALGLYTHIAYIFVLLTQLALTALWQGAAPLDWRRLLRALTPFALPALLFAPWLPTLLMQLGTRQNLVQPAPIEQMLPLLYGLLTFGITYESSMDGIGIVAAVVLLAGLLPMAGTRRHGQAALPMVWALISVGLYLSLGLSSRYLRFLQPTQVAFALWLGGGFWALWSWQPRHWYRAWFRLAALLGLGAILLSQLSGLHSLYHDPEFMRDDMRSLSRHLQENLSKGDAVIVSGAGLQDLLHYYYDADAPIYGLPTSRQDSETRAQVLDIIAARDRIFAVFYGAAQQDPNLIVETTLNRNAFEIEDRWVDDLRYVQYATAGGLPAPIDLNMRFGDSITLQAFALGGDALAAGDAILAQLTWRTTATLNRRYKVFLQLLDSIGRLVAQRDSEPAGGSAMTTSWKPGVVIADNHALLIPGDLAGGDYKLIAGLYDINDPGARLPVAGKTYLELATITVN